MDESVETYRAVERVVGRVNEEVGDRRESGMEQSERETERERKDELGEARKKVVLAASLRLNEVVEGRKRVVLTACPSTLGARTTATTKHWSQVMRRWKGECTGVLGGRRRYSEDWGIRASILRVVTAQTERNDGRR